MLTSSGASYYRARYYDPSTGRFLSEDPLRFQVGVNHYVYVGDNPTDFSDPLGLVPRLRPGDTALRPCTPGEYARCATMCGDRGVEHCRVAMHKAVVGLTKRGKPRWDWVDSQGALDCSCNEPNGECEKKEKHEFRFAPPAISPSTQKTMGAINGIGALGTLGILLLILAF